MWEAVSGAGKASYLLINGGCDYQHPGPGMQGAPADLVLIYIRVQVGAWVFYASLHP